MREIRHMKKATEISPDGIAAAAATLAIHSKYLQDHKNLFETFWVFFDDLLDSQETAQRALDEEKTRQEKEREGRRLWESSQYGVSQLGARARLMLRRAYSSGRLLKPVTELTDDDLLFAGGIGPKTLADIRVLIPQPARQPLPEEGEQ